GLAGAAPGSGGLRLVARGGRAGGARTALVLVTCGRIHRPGARRGDGERCQDESRILHCSPPRDRGWRNPVGHRTGTLSAATAARLSSTLHVGVNAVQKPLSAAVHDGPIAPHAKGRSATSGSI